MKRILFLFLLAFTTLLNSCSDDDFCPIPIINEPTEPNTEKTIILKVNARNSNNYRKINFYVNGETSINWGDNSDIENFNTSEFASVSHVFESNGVKTITISSGNLTYFSIRDQELNDFKLGDCEKLISLVVIWL